MSDPYRAPDDSPRRRLNVPGVLEILDRKLPARRDPPAPARRVHRLVLGGGAGFGAVGSLDDWKYTAHLVERATLSDALVQACGVRLPEKVLDADDMPRLVALAARAPLVEVDEATYLALMKAGARGHVVSGIRTASGYAYASGTRDATETSSDDWSSPQPEAPGSLEEASDRFGDRFVREASGGAIDETMVVLAEQLQRATEDAHAALSWEVNLPPDATPEDEVLARGIAEAIAGAPPEADEIEVPHYGRARRVRIGALSLTGRPCSIAALPRADTWLVENVAPEPRYVDVARPSAPRPAPVASRPTPRVAGSPPKAPVWQRALAALVLAAIVIAMLYLLTAR